MKHDDAASCWEILPSNDNKVQNCEAGKAKKDPGIRFLFMASFKLGVYDQRKRHGKNHKALRKIEDGAKRAGLRDGVAAKDASAKQVERKHAKHDKPAPRAAGTVCGRSNLLRGGRAGWGSVPCACIGEQKQARNKGEGYAPEKIRDVECAA